MEKKYELTDEFKEIQLYYGKHKVYRIRALRDFGDVKAGDLGGFIESERNLAHDGDCWVYNNAIVLDTARVFNNATISDNALISGSCIIYEEARVFDNAKVTHCASIRGNAFVYGHAEIRGTSLIREEASISGYASIEGHSEIYGEAQVYDNAIVTDHARVYGDARICGYARVKDNSTIYDAFVNGNARIEIDAEISKDEDYIIVQGFGSVCRSTTFYRTNDNKIRVVCGCFSGTIKEFKKKVKKTYGYTKLGREYLKLARLVEYRMRS